MWYTEHIYQKVEKLEMAGERQDIRNKMAVKFSELDDTCSTIQFTEKKHHSHYISFNKKTSKNLKTLKETDQD